MEAVLQTPQNQKVILPHLFEMQYSHPLPKKTLGEFTEKAYDGLRVSEEDYWLNYYELSDLVFEWNNGRLEEKPMSDRESYDLYSWFLRLISQYFDVFKEGTMIGLEIGFKLFVGHKTKIRKPDLAFIHKDNPVQMRPFETSYTGCFDMCFEFLSDSNRIALERDTVVKKHEYETYGVREYYILDRIGDETAFYYLDSKGKYRTLKPNRHGVIKSRVLKHFQFRLDDLYNRPSDHILVKDSVYQKYILVDYQKEFKRAEEADKKAEAERKRAKKADKKAETERKRAEEADKKTEAERERAKEADKKAKAERERAKEADKKAKAERERAKEADKKAEAERERAKEADKKAKAERERAKEADKKAEAERERAKEADKKAKAERERAKEADKKAKAERKRAKEADKKAEIERKKAKAERERADSMEKELLKLRKQLGMLEK
ncbi:MAG: Uma2 family endonuclease [Candidatus Magnetomorum sp.]|nr:Uma2 family endonuclease [Candidatus Magnetomorum sp.]